jgi:hypothetical protein
VGHDVERRPPKKWLAPSDPQAAMVDHPTSLVGLDKQPDILSEPEPMPR